MNFFKKIYYQTLLAILKVSKNDEAFAKVKFYYKNGVKLNLEEPAEFNDKLQWLKLFHYDQSYKEYVDKFEVRKYVAKTIGKSYLVDLLGIYQDVDSIDIEKLPEQFALKVTHGSGYNVIVENKTTLDWESTKLEVKRYMSLNYYHKYREIIYKDIQPRILIERYLEETEADNIIDYKFYCFDGEPECIWVKTFDNNSYCNCYYDLNWRRLGPDTTNCYLQTELSKPEKLDEMIAISKKLSKDFIFIRVDLYSINNKIYFGELTFFPWAGNERLTVEHLNQEYGELIKLPD